uniref:AN1-type zinc finger protein 1 isoform X3 n=2 Tax=Petromyzon marinus TaxID=7757 RepID=A0AAJ7XAN7_PETMA|nr:AN1-type zinc finger protein 1 isoform X3 [Petromyzon marinus]
MLQTSSRSSAMAVARCFVWNTEARMTTHAQRQLPGERRPRGGPRPSRATRATCRPARRGSCCPCCVRTAACRHRHQVDHACVNLQEAAPRMQRTQELVRGITEGRRGAATAAGRRGARSAAVTARVQLMKTKQQAVGEQGIPQEERLYLRVRLPRPVGVSEGQQQQQQQEEQEERAVFVSRAWSVGRVVDWVASATRLPNNNHVASAKKLRLCDVATLRAWPMDALVDSLLSALGSEGEGAAGEGLRDGGGVLLEYLDPGCDVAPEASPPSAT